MSFGTDLTISIDLAAENQDDRQRGDEHRGEKWCETERVTVDDRRRELKGCEQNGEGDGNGFVESIRLSTLVEKGTNGGKKEQKVVVHQRLLDEDWRGGKQEQPYPSFLMPRMSFMVDPVSIRPCTLPLFGAALLPARPWASTPRP